MRLRSDDPGLSPVLEWSSDLGEWNRSKLLFDAAAGEWTLDVGAPFAIPSAAEVSPGIWKLELQPASPDENSLFFRMRFDYQQ